MSVVSYDAEAFWRMTPRQLSLTFEAASARRIYERNERTTQAYYAAVIPLMKKIPKLEALLISKPSPNQQSGERQLAIAKAWMASRRQ
jgi:hypothetical protein